MPEPLAPSIAAMSPCSMYSRRPGRQSVCLSGYRRMSCRGGRIRSRCHSVNSRCMWPIFRAISPGSRNSTNLTRPMRTSNPRARIEGGGDERVPD